MHAGFAAVSLPGASPAPPREEGEGEEDVPGGGDGVGPRLGSPRVAARHGEPHHASLGYGADWACSGGQVAATCSFYDRRVTLWALQAS